MVCYVTFSCPLCLALGRTVWLRAEFEPAGRLMTVVSVAGCEHADSFGDLDALTGVEAWQLLEAALDAWERISSESN